MAVGDRMAAHDLTVGNGPALWCSLSVRGGGPTGERGGFRPLALEVARLRSDTSGEAVQDRDPLLALFPVQEPHAQGCHFTILATVAGIDPPDG